MSRPTSASGVAEVSAPLRRGVSPGAEVASGDGQLRHAQRAARASVAEKHPRFVCHFVPTSSSWLNLVERWFRELTEKAIRRGSFLSVPDLKQAIEEFMDAWNENPKPFIWTATVEDIIKKIDRARAKAEQIKPGSTLPRGKKKVAGL